MEDVKVFLSSGSGDGDGDGYGDGSGYGYGDGYGYGSGYGSGDGYGYGSGYGSGDGSGDGYGSGSGSGDGSGDGSGYGSGDGDGVRSINGNAVYIIDGLQTTISHLHGNVARGMMLGGDLTLTPCYIVKSGNLFAHGETLKAARDALKEKLFEGMSEDERIDAFLEEIKPCKSYPAAVFYDWHHKLTGSCDMGRAQFARDHGVDLNGTMTLGEFIGLTREAYGSDVIRQVEKRLSL